MSEVEDLRLMTAAEAARTLGVDVKTFRAMGVDHIVVGKSKRYTLTGLRSWQYRETRQCKSVPSPEPQGKARGQRQVRNISSGALGRLTGTSPSASNIFEFERRAGLPIKGTPQL